MNCLLGSALTGAKSVQIDPVTTPGGHQPATAFLIPPRRSAKYPDPILLDFAVGVPCSVDMVTVSIVDEGGAAPGPVIPIAGPDIVLCSCRWSRLVERFHLRTAFRFDHRVRGHNRAVSDYPEFGVLAVAEPAGVGVCHEVSVVERFEGLDLGEL